MEGGADAERIREAEGEAAGARERVNNTDTISMKYLRLMLVLPFLVLATALVVRPSHKEAKQRHHR